MRKWHKWLGFQVLFYVTCHLDSPFQTLFLWARKIEDAGLVMVSADLLVPAQSQPNTKNKLFPSWARARTFIFYIHKWL
jgi:hypothetical protein